MSRRLEHRDISDPIGRIIRERLTRLGVPAIDHDPLIRAVTDEVHDLVTRAQAEAYADGRADVTKEVAP